MHTSAAGPPRTPPRFSKWLDISRAVTQLWSTLFEGLAWPYVEWAARFWFAKLFFVFGMLQLMN